MKTRVYIIALLSVVTVAVNAQTYKNTYTPSTQQEFEAIQSQQIMRTNAHEGTIYEPFSNATPSEQSAVVAAQTGTTGPNHARRGFDIGGDAGQGPSPIGDAVLPMLLFALAFGGVIFLRKRRALNR